MAPVLWRALVGVLAAVVAVLGLAPPAAPAQEDPGSEVVVEYYYGEGCPVCAVTGPWLEDLEARTPGMRLEEVEVWEDETGRARLEDALERYRVPAVGVPVILVGERAWVGFREGLSLIHI